MRMKVMGLAGVLSAVLLLLSGVAQAEAIYRMGGSGIIYEYETLADLAVDNHTQLGQISTYANDGWFTWDDTIYRTAGNGALIGYATFDDFLTNTQIGGGALATHSAYAGDEWFVFDSGSGDRIYRITNGGAFIEYADVNAVIANNGNQHNGLSNALEDDGIFALNGTIYAIADGSPTLQSQGTSSQDVDRVVQQLGTGRAPDAGEVLAFDSIADLQEGSPITAFELVDGLPVTLLGTGDPDYGYLANHSLITDINGYADDGWFTFARSEESVPAPAGIACLGLAAIGLTRRGRRSA